MAEVKIKFYSFKPALSPYLKAVNVTYCVAKLQKCEISNVAVGVVWHFLKVFKPCDQSELEPETGHAPLPVMG